MERRRAERQRSTAAINRPERRNMEPEGARRSKGEERRERGPDRLCERRSSEDQAGQQEEQGGRRGGGEGEAATAGGRNNSSVSILYLNAQSIVGKVDELASSASEIDPDLILVVESWCNSNISDAFLSIPGYEMQQDLRLDREDTEGGRGGGLLVYTKNGIKILSCDKVVNFHQYCKFLLNDITVYLIYRPPSGGAVSIDDLTALISAAEKRCILIGDFNLPEINWEDGHARGRAAHLLEAAENVLMEQLVTFTTHTRGNRLDLLLTNIPERVVDVQEAGRLGHSDHTMILAKVTTNKVESGNPKEQLDWNRADWNSMRENMASINWRERMENKSGSEAWEMLRDHINTMVAENVPARRRRNQNRPAWLSKEILCAIRRKKRLWTKARQGGPREEYVIRNAKRKHEKKLAEGGGKDGKAKRQFYAYVKQRTKTRPSIGPLKNKEGHVVSNDKDMAEIFNEFFSSVFTREDTEQVPEPQEMHFRSELRETQVTTKKVKEKIKNYQDSAKQIFTCS